MGLIAAVVVGSVTWALTRGVYGLAAGAGALILIGLRAFEERLPLGGFRYRFPSRGWLVSCAIAAVLVALVLGGAADAKDGQVVGIVVGVITGLVAGLLAVTAVGLRVVAFDLTVAASPRAILARDRLTVIVIGISAGMAIATIAALFVGFRSGQVATSIVTGLGVFVAAGLAVIASRGAWPSWELTRIWLAFRRKLPWRLTAFLGDAHKRGVLRQAGAVYQFRHAELQQRLGIRQE